MPNYGDLAYWEQRYTKEPCAFDWYQGYPGLKHILTKYLPKDGKILQIGVGTSRIQEDMVREGYSDITNIDYSKVAIAHVAQLHAGLKQLKYCVMDARSMPQFHGASFDGSLDKGTIDAVLCGERSLDNCYKMLFEVYRVLRPGAVHLVVTYGAPDSRLPSLNEFDWGSIEVFIIDRLDALDGIPEAGGQPALQVKGPYAADDAAAMEALSALQNMHFVYACHKPHDAVDPPAAAPAAPPAVAPAAAPAGPACCKPHTAVDAPAAPMAAPGPPAAALAAPATASAAAAAAASS